MIATDQPHIFPEDKTLVRFSSRSDGSMLMREIAIHAPEAVQNRQRLCAELKLHYEDVIYQVISYDPGGSYNTLALVDGRHSMRYGADIRADALITDQPGLALFLPVADCVATALYDPTHHVIAILHLGRHSTVTDLVSRVIGTMTTCFGTQPADLLAYLSPAAQRNSYKLSYFEPIHEPEWQQFIEQQDDGISVDLPGFNRQALLKAGVQLGNIEISNVDTYTSEDYFSHSRGDKNGRQALVAMIR